MKLHNLHKTLVTAALTLLCQSGLYAETATFNYDLNADNKFDNEDVTCLATKILETEEWDAGEIAHYDVNADGEVNVADIIAMLEAIKTHVPPVGIDGDGESPDEANAPVRREEE